VISWEGSSTAGQPSMWPPPPLVPALLPHLRTRDTGRHHRHLQLEGKPRCGECLRGRHRRRSRSDFFFATDGKTFVPTFNCYLRNTSQCRTTRLHVHLSSSDLLHRPNVTSLMRSSTWDDPVRVMAVAPTTMRRRDELCFVMYLCRKTTTMDCR
jgi:hypothetical protein